MRFTLITGLALALTAGSTLNNVLALATETPVEDQSCTLTNPLTKEYYDLRPLTRTSDLFSTDWSVNGHDYGANFTLNICAPLLNTTDDAPHSSAGYVDEDGQFISIGDVNTVPILRGRRLTLELPSNTPCPTGPSKRTTLISFLCDRDLTQKSAITFVGSPHSCDYFFEWRTARACPIAHGHGRQKGLGVGSLFGLLAILFLLAYFVGGIVYQRVVMRQSGWRQVPHYHTLRSVVSFVADMVMIIGATVWSKIPGLKNLGSMGRGGRGRIQLEDEAVMDEALEGSDDEGSGHGGARWA
ncbi:mannose 6-phosphate receptor domain-containing protein [Saitoella complicata NRRL Y-17804]|uniref:mannose 6-phosphate receptor domain-containing protein n=1 Tax=Saitoella complicata (strain BCRC 22490 / CBS 7301 / JCM 7358 / NBRC 10748 / NRRL Y-17804) TaxID=698492 RepID=UPI0008675BBC|nr:mannose 6-phosphate receptor domain-containing protein [Saitoella complicata NRRL Y-17804]ODQ50897.1 mannose 6-phosphate receptor domain-containing protein [Saitoella complicata NRRL Y-17804]